MLLHRFSGWVKGGNWGSVPSGTVLLYHAGALRALQTPQAGICSFCWRSTHLPRVYITSQLHGSGTSTVRLILSVWCGMQTGLLESGRGARQELYPTETQYFPLPSTAGTNEQLFLRSIKHSNRDHRVQQFILFHLMLSSSTFPGSNRQWTAFLNSWFFSRGVDMNSKVNWVWN